MSKAGYIGSIPNDQWVEMRSGSVPDSLRANVELMHHAHEGLHLRDPVASVMEYERRTRARAAPDDPWDAVDLSRLESEYKFAWNWCNAGSPIFSLTHSTAALLSTTRAPSIDFDHAPFPAFLISVPDQFLPLYSARPRPVRWIGVEAGALMGTAGGGNVIAIPDGDTLSNAAGVGANGQLSEESVNMMKGADAEQRRLLGVTIRLAANVIRYVTQYQGTDSIRKTSSPSSPVLAFDVRPPAGITVDRAFRDLAAELVRARDFKGARRALSHLVRGHWRNQPVGTNRSERRLTWIKPFRRGDESFGVVIQRTIRIEKDT